MSVQPNYPIIPTQPPPQTVSGILQQSGVRPKPSGVMPGEVPMLAIHAARAQLIGTGTVTTDNQPGDEISLLSNYNRPLLPAIVLTPQNNFRLEPAYTMQFYMSQCSWWNAEIVLHFFAVKPPPAVGRLRIVYIPPSFDTAADPAQRNITEEWDLSASNLFEFKVPSYNLRAYRSCVAHISPVNGLSQNFYSPVNDFKAGEIHVYVANSYQPGSIYVSDFSLYIFQSFQNSQFAGVVGPGIPAERTAFSQSITIV